MDQGIGGTGFATDDDLDDMNPARGIIFGFLLSAAGWGVASVLLVAAWVW